MRGKHEIRVTLRHPFRITPAGAGKTLIDEAKQENAEDHPRRCGENERQAAEHLRAEGSPPQVRGKRRRVERKHKLAGITPAGAGKTRRLNT